MRQAWRVFGWRGLAIASLVTLLAACEAPPPPAPSTLAEGAAFPALPLKTLDGASISRGAIPGKVLVLNVWATWCGPCREEMPSLQRLADQLDPARFAVVGISIDEDNFIAREFLIERKVHFTSYLDPGGAVTRERLGVQAVPATFLVGPDGRLVRLIVGPRVWDGAEMVSEIHAVAKASGAR